VDKLFINGDFDNTFVPLGTPLPNVTINFVDQYNNAVYPVGQCVVKFLGDLLCFTENRLSTFQVKVRINNMYL
jgi:hypothetical protein